MILLCHLYEFPRDMLRARIDTFMLDDYTQYALLFRCNAEYHLGRDGLDQLRASLLLIGVARDGFTRHLYWAGRLSLASSARCAKIAAIALGACQMTLRLLASS